MLSKKHRFHGRGGVPHLMRKGRRLRGQDINLVYLPPTKNRLNTRIAVIVSKKVSKSAPVRNRLRRQAYAHLSGVYASLPAGSDIAIVVKPHTTTIDFPQQINSAVSRMDGQRR